MLKFALILASAAVLLVSVLLKSVALATIGAVLFVAGTATELRTVLHASRAYRAGNHNPWPVDQRSAGVRRTTKWLEGAIAISGLVAMLAGSDNRSGLFLPGALIWLGGIGIWFIAGLIAREASGVPLKMGYGGWYVSRRNRRLRRQRRR